MKNDIFQMVMVGNPMIVMLDQCSASTQNQEKAKKNAKVGFRGHYLPLYFVLNGSFWSLASTKRWNRFAGCDGTIISGIQSIVNYVLIMCTKNY